MKFSTRSYDKLDLEYKLQCYRIHLLHLLVYLSVTCMYHQECTIYGCIKASHVYSCTPDVDVGELGNSVNCVGLPSHSQGILSITRLSIAGIKERISRSRILVVSESLSLSNTER